MRGALIAAAAVAAAAAPPARGADLQEGVWAVSDEVADPTAVLRNVKIALRQSDVPGLRRALHAVSDPASPRYGRHLSGDEVTAFVRSPAEGIAAVTAWLDARGVAHAVTPHQDYVALPGLTAGRAAELFAAEVRVLRHAGSGREVLRAPAGYTMPAALRPHADLLAGLTGLPARRVRRRRAPAAAGEPPSAADAAAGAWPQDCDGVSTPGKITPAVLFQRYNITAGAVPKASVAAILPGGDSDSSFGAKDVTDTQTKCGMTANPISKVVGKMSKKYDCGEATLDTNVIGYMTEGGHTEFWSSDADDMLGMFSAIADAKDAAPKVVSCSFGDGENTPDGKDDRMTKTSTEMMKLGAMGVTIVVSSGDCGCVSDDKACDGRLKKLTKTEPSFPATSPYALAVGGSQFLPTKAQKGGDVIGEEKGVELGQQNGDKWATTGSSGGGFSWTFDTPDFQKDAVSKYLASGLPFPAASKWNRKGRGFPDVATLAGLPNEPDVITNYYMRCKGKWIGMDGTSASSPAMAGMIARLNHARVSRGKSTLGWINPFLYSAAAKTPAAFNDITKGDNWMTWGEGFNATKGWDAVTGLGSPNYGVLEELALQLP